ncbi:hypothetical protein DF268_08450 [Streptomyces sp. V2]|uniref:hypothetical protein n=1 Tax=Streptomyces sp. V2 TaxID=1424099 RepID=UPI000D66AF9B|nr:hypothetical protein [Streptomyces sp. V2]PWG13892.1 hypothetical protein DF268_08450 [Streptomyces sp. V2]
MIKVKLANWYGDKAPGEELDVDEATLKALHRDGRIASVIAADSTVALDPAAGEESGPEAAEPVPSQAGRKRR